MPDGITAGPGFPPNNVQLGHLHFRTDQNIVYQYQGGTSSNVNSWYPITGKNIAFANGNDITGEIPLDTNPFLIAFGVTFSLNITVVNGTDFIVQQAGTYLIEVHSQISKTAGAAFVFVDQWLRLNGVDIPNTGSRNGVTSANDLKVLISTDMVQLNVGDKIQAFIAVSQAGIGLGTYAFTNGVGPTIPATEFHMLKID